MCAPGEDTRALESWEMVPCKPGSQGNPGGMFALSQPRVPKASCEGRGHSWSASIPYTQHFLSISCLHPGSQGTGANPSSHWNTPGRSRSSELWA